MSPRIQSAASTDLVTKKRLVSSAETMNVSEERNQDAELGERV